MDFARSAPHGAYWHTNVVDLTGSKEWSIGLTNRVKPTQPSADSHGLLLVITSRRTSNRATWTCQLFQLKWPAWQCVDSHTKSRTLPQWGLPLTSLNQTHDLTWTSGFSCMVWPIRQRVWTVHGREHTHSRESSEEPNIHSKVVLFGVLKHRSKEEQILLLRKGVFLWIYIWLGNSLMQPWIQGLHPP